jgi:hypothetical protein
MHTEYSRLLTFKSDNNETIIDIENSIRNSLLDNNNNINQQNNQSKIYFFCSFFLLCFFIIITYTFVKLFL